MGELLISIFYLVRPMMFVEISLKLGGMNFFEFITILFSLVLAAIAIRNVVGGNKKSLSDIEIVMVVFIVWCTFILLLDYVNSSFKEYVKWILPLITYIVLKRSINTKEQYIKIVHLLILGYLIPVIVNFVFILQGKGLGQVIYWTGLERYSGIYSGIHMMAHNMGFFIMLIAMYYVLVKETPKVKISRLKYLIIAVLSILALYCLYKSQTRTVFVGLTVFISIWLYRYNKKLLMFVSGVIFVSSILLAPYLATVFFDVIEAVEGKRDIERAGSGRPLIWKHNLTIYSELGIDRKISGVGIGNTKSFIEGSGHLEGVEGVVWNSHNDYLETLMQTGAIGFILQFILYVLIYKKIRKIKSPSRGVYEAMFFAVVLMNILSNSYISRFGIAQLFFMIMVFIELPDQVKNKTEKDEELVVSNQQYTRGVRLR